MTPKDVIAGRIGQARAAALIDDLLEAGWIIVRHDAIRLAQAHAREEVTYSLRSEFSTIA